MDREKINYLVVALLIGAGIAGAFYIASHPLFAPSDSCKYIISARSILEGRGFSNMSANYTGPENIYEPNISWPPLYSFLIAAGSYITGLSVFQMLPVLNVLFWAVFLLSFANIYRLQFSASSVFFPVAVFFLVVSLGMWTYVGSAASEVLFMAMAALACNFLILSDRAIRFRRSYGYVIAAGIFAMLAVLTRYAGMAMAAGMALFLLWPAGKIVYRNTLLKAVTFAAIVGAGLGAWLLRNQLLTDNLTFMERLDRVQYNIVADSIAFYNNHFVAFTGWPERLEKYAVLLLIPIAAIVVYLFRNAAKIRSMPGYAGAIFLQLFILVPYLALLHYVALKYHFSPSRYTYLLQPYYAGIILGMFSIVRLSETKRVWRLLFLAVCGGLAGIMAFTGARRTVDYFKETAHRNAEASINGIYMPAFMESLWIYDMIGKSLGPNDLLISNFCKFLPVITNKPCHESKEISSLDTLINSGRYNVVYFALYKEDTHWERPDWRKYLEGRRYQVLHEDESAIYASVPGKKGAGAEGKSQ